MPNVKYMEAVFQNGDKLVLNLSMHEFAGFKPCTLFELMYAERVEGNHECVSDDEPVSDDPHFFYIHQTEYFDEGNLNMAIKGFNVRLVSENPRAATGLSQQLCSLLTKK